jgi:hypothetical protein
MERKALLGAAATLLLAVSGTSWATTVDLGDVAPGESVGSSLFYGQNGTAVDDTWIFTLTASVQFAAVVVDSADLEPAFGIADFVVSDPSGTLSFDYDSSDNSYGFSGLLAAGTYQFTVTGTTSGQLGGGYDLLVGGTSASVPLPATSWLLFAAMSFLPAMRRKISTT